MHLAVYYVLTVAMGRPEREGRKMTREMTKGYEAVTAETLTDEQVKGLRAGAAEAGDAVMVAVCDVALASSLADGVPESCEGVQSELERLGIIPQHIDADVHAREVVADAINDARAQG
jgi:hypothetical protein